MNQQIGQQLNRPLSQPLNQQLEQPLNPQLNQPIGHQISNPPQFNLNQQQTLPPPPNNSRNDPPLLPPFELSLKNNSNNQLNNNNQFNHLDRNKPFNNNFKKKNKNNADRGPDSKFKKETNDKSPYGDKPARQSEAEKSNRNQKNSSNNSEANHQANHQKHHQSRTPVNQMAFNQSTNNHKLNPLIPNQLDQESGAADESNSIFDAAKRKKLPEWIREGLEKMEKEKQKRIEKEENLIKKAKEEQLRRELELDDEDDEEPENVKSTGHRDEEPAARRSGETGEEKRKLFSSSFHQKTFADMFLVKKAKDYYYENEQEREKELMLRTRKVLTSILLEVTDALVRQVASKCIQEAKIQKSRYLLGLKILYSR